MVLLLALLLLLLAIGTLAMAVGQRQPSGLARSLQTLDALGPSPDQLAEQTEQPFGERVVAPLQARALVVGRRITGTDSTERIRHKLDLAGNPRDWSVDRVISLKVIAAVVAPAVGVAYAALLGLGLLWILVLGLAGLLVGFLAPDLYLYQRAYTRSEQMLRALPDAVDLLAISVEAGLGFDASLRQVARNTGGPLAEEFSRVLREMQIGQGRAEALRALAGRTNVDDLQAFVGAMVQADSFGIPVGQVLRIQSAEMRIKRRQRAETKAQQVPVKITVPLIFCILPCLFIAVIGPAALNVIDNLG